jgi:hypothetical protein
MAPPAEVLSQKIRVLSGIVARPQLDLVEVGDVGDDGASVVSCCMNVEGRGRARREDRSLWGVLGF